MYSELQKPTSIFSKETNHEKSTHRNLVCSSSHHNLGRLHNPHHHAERSNHHMHDLLLRQQLHHQLFLRSP